MAEGLDQDAILGIKSAVLKAGAAGTLLGILWRRQYRLVEALSAAAAGMCSSIYVAPAVIAWAAIVHDDIKSLVIFGSGLLGMYIIDAAVKYGPQMIRSRLKLPEDPRPPEGGGGTP